ncbi:hypothetical protein J2Z48_001236 [Croceifilum oryzae]|uniref:Uncharacterized protein n=1 Tax=Croceifilum oryzae TaxID=1553429 RepID=A0AAJ1TJC4_9BACL|nr:hypothetical protein [Croceifilum oryzae]MDQ0417064.1 hypothetical protein [Croceifilum oryzae]
MSSNPFFCIELTEVMTLDGDLSPDATYSIGNTTIHVIAPKITEEERLARLEDIKKLIIQLRLSNESNQQNNKQVCYTNKIIN